MLPDLTSLELFRRAYELGSLSKAAKELHLTLSAASRRIAILEQRMNVQLLRRTSTGVLPTAAGTALAFHAKQLLLQAEKLHVEIGDYADGSRGVVRMCATASALSGPLPQDLAAFTESNPRLKIELLERRTAEGIAAVRDGRSDIAIVHASDPLLAELRFEHYRAENLVAVVPREHPLNNRSIAFHRLLDYDFVGLEGNTPLMALLQDASRAAGKTLRLTVQVWSFDVVCRMIKANMGIGVLPNQAAKTYCNGLKLRTIALSDKWASRYSYICTPNTKLSVAAQRMVEHLRSTR
ncbi:LysR family transcriptional regulator [Candidimonas nitroreducens]|uniref:LysR family transcriptional regulator n=1 Tax=Candidimonas nitroreducens TaxID=683354 RepID=A0A225MBT9_9BURK|nr:LysR family transcriptional regulator [Candidimonas nitroreducens]OWT57610.1 LysR family transcriptional regulator [Candidimonas nitroreducens]